MKPESERFLAGMKTESLPADLQNIIKLGLAKESELPSTLKYSRQVGSTLVIRLNLRILPIRVIEEKLLKGLLTLKLVLISKYFTEHSET